MGITFVKIMLAEYIIAVILFTFDKDYPRALYFAGAAILSIGILTMKGG